MLVRADGITSGICIVQRERMIVLATRLTFDTQGRGSSRDGSKRMLNLHELTRRREGGEGEAADKHSLDPRLIGDCELTSKLRLSLGWT